jgi:nicotinamide mononucleotide transporter
MLQALLNAAQPLLAPAFQLWGNPVTWLEIAAALISLAMVWANMRVRPIGWPLAIVASLLYGLLFWDGKLYGEAALQVMFVLLALWGWWQWVQGQSGDGGHRNPGDTSGDSSSNAKKVSSTPLQVRSMGTRSRWTAGIYTLAAWPLLGALLARFTDSPAPYLDALATAGSITGQILLGRKLRENWLVWLAVNVFSVALFASRSYWLTALLYAVFAVLSWAGWRAWARQAPSQRDGIAP